MKYPVIKVSKSARARAKLARAALKANKPRLMLHQKIARGMSPSA